MNVEGQSGRGVPPLRVGFNPVGIGKTEGCFIRDVRYSTEKRRRKHFLILLNKLFAIPSNGASVVCYARLRALFFDIGLDGQRPLASRATGAARSIAWSVPAARSCLVPP